MRIRMVVDREGLIAGMVYHLAVSEAVRFIRMGWAVAAVAGVETTAIAMPGERAVIDGGKPREIDGIPPNS